MCAAVFMPLCYCLFYEIEYTTVFDPNRGVPFGYASSFGTYYHVVFFGIIIGIVVSLYFASVWNIKMLRYGSLILLCMVAGVQIVWYSMPIRIANGLFLAAEAKNEAAMAKYLQDPYITIILLRPDDRITPLRWLIRSGKIRLAKYYIDAGYPAPLELKAEVQRLIAERRLRRQQYPEPECDTHRLTVGFCYNR